jgi:hypothetical protein
MEVPSSTGNKSGAVAVLLATLPGLVGLLGMGHFYLRRFRRAVVFLLGGLLLVVATWLSIGTWIGLGMTVPPPGYAPVDPPAYRNVFVVVSFLTSVGFVALWVVQIFDARRACRAHNAARAEAGSVLGPEAAQD